jgi:1-acyl-sn-glycerol-3-phosphate acyltransferase
MLNIISGLLQRFWFIWSVLSFIALSFVAFVAYFVVFNFAPKHKIYLLAFKITKIWGKFTLFFMGVRVRVWGVEKLPKQQSAYVIVSNHQSAIDIPLCMSVCPLPFSFLAKIEADKIPVVGYLARNMHVYVDRKSNESRQESYQRMKKHLEAGKSIHIYPEGTRNMSNDPIAHFHDGAFRLAIETQRPLLVLTLIDANKVLSPKTSFKASPGVVDCVWSTPISTVGMSLNEVDVLKKIAEHKILANLSAKNLAQTV